MDVLEKMYRYCMKKGFRFSFTEDKDFISVMFSSEVSDKLFSYCFSKENNKILYLRIDEEDYDDIETALQDFDDYDLLRRG